MPTRQVRARTAVYRRSSSSGSRGRQKQSVGNNLTTGPVPVVVCVGAFLVGVIFFLFSQGSEMRIFPQESYNQSTSNAGTYTGNTAGYTGYDNQRSEADCLGSNPITNYQNDQRLTFGVRQLIEDLKYTASSVCGGEEGVVISTYREDWCQQLLVDRHANDPSQPLAASNSLHLTGDAVDIKYSSVCKDQVQKIAKKAMSGGCGFFVQPHAKGHNIGIHYEGRGYQPGCVQRYIDAR